MSSDLTHEPQSRPDRLLLAVRILGGAETDFHGVDWHGQELAGVELWDANLSKANLEGANFTRGNLEGANLQGANLSKAILSAANLAEADLTGANLFEACLVKADLRGADLSQANLRRANLTEANVTEAIFEDTFLEEALLPKEITRDQLAEAKFLLKRNSLAEVLGIHKQKRAFVEKFIEHMDRHFIFGGFSGFVEGVEEVFELLAEFWIEPQGEEGQKILQAYCSHVIRDRYGDFDHWRGCDECGRDFKLGVTLVNANRVAAGDPLLCPNCKPKGS